MESSELAIPAYLNQASVFDLLSIVQDGFSTVKTIKTSTSHDSKNDISVEANAESNLGVKNIFSLLSIGIKGKYEHIGEQSKQDEEQFEKVYTPTSLFWRLRDYLVKNELIKKVVFEAGEMKVKAGEFIEFEGKFEKNPLIESIENIQKLIDLVYVLSPETLETETRSNPGGGKTPKHLPGKKPAIIDQIDVFAKSLKLDDTIDLIADDV
jgi:hypothetical protein